MAKNPAPKTGTYKVGDDYFHFAQGDELPEGAVFNEAPVVEDEEERARPAPSENKARNAAPENRSAG